MFAGDGYIDQAFRIIRAVPDNLFIEKDLALEAIGNALVEAGDFDQAIKIAETLSRGGDGQIRLFSYIFKQLARTGDSSKAILVVKDISEKELRSQLLQEIFEELMSAGRFSEAFEMARAIPLREKRHAILKKLSLQL